MPAYEPIRDQFKQIVGMRLRHTQEAESQFGTLLRETMTAVGAVKTVTADSLAINDGPGKDWTFVIDATTKIILRKGQETIDVTQASPVEGGKRIPSKTFAITDLKEDQRVEVKYHNVNGKIHATQVRAM